MAAHSSEEFRENPYAAFQGNGNPLNFWPAPRGVMRQYGLGGLGHAVLYRPAGNDISDVLMYQLVNPAGGGSLLEIATKTLLDRNTILFNQQMEAFLATTVLSDAGLVTWEDVLLDGLMQLSDLRVVLSRAFVRTGYRWGKCSSFLCSLCNRCPL